MGLINRFRAYRTERYLLGKNIETIQKSLENAGQVDANDYRIFINRMAYFYDGVSLKQSDAFRAAALAIADGTRTEITADEVLKLADKLAHDRDTENLGSIMQRNLGVKTWRNLIVGHVERHALTL